MKVDYQFLCNFIDPYFFLSLGNLKIQLHCRGFRCHMTGINFHGSFNAANSPDFPTFGAALAWKQGRMWARPGGQTPCFQALVPLARRKCVSKRRERLGCPFCTKSSFFIPNHTGLSHARSIHHTLLHRHSWWHFLALVDGCVVLCLYLTHFDPFRPSCNVLPGAASCGRQLSSNAECNLKPLVLVFTKFQGGFRSCAESLLVHVNDQSTF